MVTTTTGRPVIYFHCNCFTVILTVTIGLNWVFLAPERTIGYLMRALVLIPEQPLTVITFGRGAVLTRIDPVYVQLENPPSQVSKFDHLI